MRVLLAGVVALGLGWPHIATATSRGRVAVVPLEVRGELGQTWQGELAAGVLEGLARGDFDVVQPDALLRSAPEADSCDDPACWRRVAAAADAKYMVRAVVLAGDDRHYTVSVELVDGDTGEVAAESTEVCELCGVQEVRELVADQSATLRLKLDDLLTGAPTLVISSAPTQARVLLDGEVIGQTPLRREVPAGRHVARAEKDGFVSLEREFLAVAGVEERIAFDLVPLPDTRRRFRPWGWVGVAAGVAALVPGATLLALDERPAPGDRCAGDNVDAAGNCRFRYDTLVPGVALTVAGAVLCTVGVAVLVATRKRRPSTSRKAALSGAGVRF